MKKPMIGITPLWDEEKECLWMRPGYFEGIKSAGGLPVILPLMTDHAPLSQILENVAGLLFTGGQDINPVLYGQEPLAVCGRICRKRDEMESKLFAEALRLDKPIFGICRGLQLFNVLLGGSLYQDIPTQTGGDIPHVHKPPHETLAHDVKIEVGSPLRSLLQKNILSVNSNHHQGIRALAPSLAVMATAPDNLPEAVHMPAKSFVWAVQWHPEHDFLEPDNQALFAALVKAASQFRYRNGE
jgi:putative glutamine amidotransferase